MASPQMVFPFLQLVQEHRQEGFPQAIVLPLANLLSKPFLILMAEVLASLVTAIGCKILRNDDTIFTLVTVRDTILSGFEGVILPWSALLDFHKFNS
jgi:hypothetical protein